MPQSSLLGWLNKPAAVKSPETAKSRTTASDSETGLPTPPSSSQDSLPATTTVSLQSLPTAQGQITAHDEQPLPSNVELRACTKEDIPHLKRLNSLLLPISYPESFYREIIEDQVVSNITLLAVWHDNPRAAGQEKGRLVGAIRCRLLAYPPTSGWTSENREGSMLYLSTLVLLSPYRSHGIAARMLEIVTKRAIKEYGIASLGAHVWEANMEGLEWYRKRGFREGRKEEGYYRKLKPQGAIVVQRRVGVKDLLER